MMMVMMVMMVMKRMVIDGDGGSHVDDDYVDDHGDDDFNGVGTVENRMCLLKMMIYSQLSEDE